MKKALVPRDEIFRAATQLVGDPEQKGVWVKPTDSFDEDEPDMILRVSIPDGMYPKNFDFVAGVLRIVLGKEEKVTWKINSITTDDTRLSTDASKPQDDIGDPSHTIVK